MRRHRRLVIAFCEILSGGLVVAMFLFYLFYVIPNLLGFVYDTLFVFQKGF
ncbi:hypothetical protein ACPF04_05880 [Campylobacter sp. MOP51]|uniref:hypothetical protein n=1 Tax=Campylobacter canis TaxID=3378588 RepID=UPI003C52880D